MVRDGLFGGTSILLPIVVVPTEPPTHVHGRRAPASPPHLQDLLLVDLPPMAFQMGLLGSLRSILVCISPLMHAGDQFLFGGWWPFISLGSGKLYLGLSSLFLWAFEVFLELGWVRG